MGFPPLLIFNSCFMKIWWIVPLLLLEVVTLQAQTHLKPDTLQVDLKHLKLDDVVIIDALDKEHKPSKSPGHHQLEAQLKQLKGINLISRGTYAQEAIFRGQQDARLQVRLNGMRIYSACTDRMDPATSYVAANNLQFAEVSSACESSCSSSGLAGNLDLKLKQATFNKEKPWRWGLSQQIHSNTRGAVSNLNLEHQVKNFAWRLNGMWQQHQNYRSGGGKLVPYSQNEKHNWALSTAWRISEKEVLNTDIIYDLATNVGYPSLPMDVGEAQGVIAGITYSNYEGLWKFSRFDWKLYHNDVYHEMDDTQREDVFMHMNMPGWSKTSGMLLNAYGWKFGNHTLSFTAEYYTNYRRAEMTMYPSSADEPAMFMYTWPDARTHGAAIGLTDDWKWSENHLNITGRLDLETSKIVDDLGARQWQGMGYTMNGRNFLLPQIKASFMRHISQSHSLAAAASYGQRAPSTSELYGFYLFNAHDGYDYLGKPDLRPETLSSAELIHGFNHGPLKLSSTLFLQRYKNYIFGLNSSLDKMTWGARGVRIYQNTHHALFFGMETSAEFTLYQKLHFTAGAEYLRALLNDKQNLPLIPPLQGRLGIVYSHKSWSFSGKARAAGNQTNYSPEYGDRYTPAYAVIDASVSYSYKFNRLQTNVELSASNILDHYYRDHLNWGGIPSMGRNMVIILSLNY